MIYVCYTGRLVAPPMALPTGVRALRHVNLGTSFAPLAKPSASCHAVASDGTIAGSVLNFEPDGVTPTPLWHWPGIFKAHWSDVCVAYGIDAGLKPYRGKVYDHEPGTLAKFLRQPTAKGDKVRYARLGYDLYYRPGYEARNKYLAWTKHRAGRMTDVGDRNKCRSLAFLDVQRQFDGDDPTGDGVVIHEPQHVQMQIDAVPHGVDHCIFAVASTVAARRKVDAAVLRAISQIQSTKETT